MTNKKVTKREKFEMLKALSEVKANPMLTEFIDHELELLAKKNASEKKPTAQQMANEGLKDVILNVLTENGGQMTITDIQKATEELAELSNQRISALVRQLKDDGKVERVEDKRKAYFKAI
jgi:predicted RNA-binding protein (virulence factor B family)